MKISWLIFSILVNGFLLESYSHAEIRWKAAEATLTVNEGDREAVALFDFENAGKETIVIESITPSCDCTTVDFSGREYNPGQTGQIKAIYRLDKRVGLQEQTLQVRFRLSHGEPLPKEKTLRLNINILESVTVEPRVLLWKKEDDNPIDKIVKIKCLGSRRISRVDISCDAGHPGPNLQTISPGMEYSFSVHSNHTGLTDSYRIRIAIEMEEGDVRERVVYAVIR